MSLLMQALRKAERAKRNLPHGEDDMVKPSEEFDDVLELAPPEPPPRHDRRATDAPDLSPPDAAPGLQLEPLDNPLALAEPSDFAPQPPDVVPAVADPAPWRPNRSAEAPGWTLSEADSVQAAAHPSPTPGATVPDDAAAAAAPNAVSIPSRGLSPGDSPEPHGARTAESLQGSVPRDFGGLPPLGSHGGADSLDADGLQPLEAGGTRVPPPEIPASRVPHDASQGSAHGSGDGAAAPHGAGSASAYAFGDGAASRAGATRLSGSGAAGGRTGTGAQHVHAADLHGINGLPGVGSGARGTTHAHANTFEPAAPTLSTAEPPRISRTGPPPRQQRSAAAPTKAAPRGFDARTIRIAALLGVLVIISGTFGYIYWRAVYGPGSSKHLPGVPMPGLSGSTQPAGGAAAGAVAGGGTVSGLVIPNAAAPAPAAPYTPGPATAYQPAPVPPAAPTEAAAGISAPLPSQIGASPTPVPPPGTAASTRGAGGPGVNISAAPATIAPMAAVPSTAAPLAAAPIANPAPAAAAPAVPLPTPEQLRNLSPEDYMRMDRQAAAAADAEAQRALAGAGAAGASSGVTVRSSTAAAAGAPPVQGTTTAPVAMPPVASGSGATVQVSHAITPAQVNPILQGAYSAYRAGDLAGARTQYNAMLAQDATNRDAQLGLAAIALRERQPEEAAALYGRLLQSDPNDPDAMAGMASIRGADTSQAEARLRRLLAQSPEAPGALYALGNLYARQNRWSEAQAQFFKAFAAAPDNADYAFNLAVSLDRVNKPRLALDYYQRAVALAGSHAASFDRNAAARRIRELGGR